MRMVVERIHAPAHLAQRAFVDRIGRARRDFQNGVAAGERGTDELLPDPARRPIVDARRIRKMIGGVETRDPERAKKRCAFAASSRSREAGVFMSIRFCKLHAVAPRCRCSAMRRPCEARIRSASETAIQCRAEIAHGDVDSSVRITGSVRQLLLCISATRDALGMQAMRLSTGRSRTPTMRTRADRHACC